MSREKWQLWGVVGIIIGMGIYNLIFGLLMMRFGVGFLVSMMTIPYYGAGVGISGSNMIGMLVLIAFDYIAFPCVLWLMEIAVFGFWRKRTIGYFSLWLVLSLLPFPLQFVLCNLYICTEQNSLAPLAVSAAFLLLALPMVLLRWQLEKPDKPENSV